MSAMAGISIHPDAVVRTWTSTGAPQVGQLRSVPTVWVRHHGHVYVDVSLIGWLLAIPALSVRLAVVVHRLDPDPAGPDQPHEGDAGAGQRGGGRLQAAAGEDAGQAVAPLHE